MPQLRCNKVYLTSRGAAIKANIIVGSYWLHSLGNTRSLISVQNARSFLSPWNGSRYHCPTVGDLDSGRGYVVCSLSCNGIHSPPPPPQRAYILEGGQMLNKPKKSYNAEEQDAIKLLTRRLNAVLGAGWRHAGKASLKNCDLYQL